VFEKFPDHLEIRNHVIWVLANLIRGNPPLEWSLVSKLIPLYKDILPTFTNRQAGRYDKVTVLEGVSYLSSNGIFIV